MRASWDRSCSDSFSTTASQDLARAAGRPWPSTHRGLRRSKKLGLANLPFRGEWILILDADERSPAAAARFRKGPRHVRRQRYYINLVLLFMGAAVRHGGLVSVLELASLSPRRRRATKTVLSRACHLRRDDRILRGELLHIRRESIWQYIEKHIRFPIWRSIEWIRPEPVRAAARRRASSFAMLFDIANGWPAKSGRPCPFAALAMAYMYIIRLGFLDGRAGWHLARLMPAQIHDQLLYNEKLGRIRELESADRIAPRAICPAAPMIWTLTRMTSPPEQPPSALRSDRGRFRDNAASTAPSIGRSCRQTLFRWSSRRTPGWRRMCCAASGQKSAQSQYSSVVRVFHPCF